MICPAPPPDTHTHQHRYGGNASVVVRRVRNHTYERASGTAVGPLLTALQAVLRKIGRARAFDICAQVI